MLLDDPQEAVTCFSIQARSTTATILAVMAARQRD
jgi:hypothetical protein